MCVTEITEGNYGHYKVNLLRRRMNSHGQLQHCWKGRHLRFTDVRDSQRCNSLRLSN